MFGAGKLNKFADSCKLVVLARGVHTSPVPEPRDPIATAVFIELLLVIVSIAVVILGMGLLFSGGLLPAVADLGPAAMLFTPACWLLAGALYRAFGSRVDGPEHAIGPLEPPTGRPGVGAALGEVAIHCVIAIVGSTILAQLLSLTGLQVAEQADVLKITKSGFALRSDLLFLALSALIAAPLTEEWLFRGQLFRRLLAVSGPAAAFTLSATLFAVIHGNWTGFFIYTWLGLVFARVYLRTGRLWTAMLVHMGNNAVTLAILVFLPNLGEAPPADENAKSTPDVALISPDRGLRSPAIPDRVRAPSTRSSAG